LPCESPETDGLNVVSQGIVTVERRQRRHLKPNVGTNRLILGATKAVDIATLTGACMVALGTGVAGLFTPDDSMSAALEAAGAKVGEKLWRMPMEESYWEQMESPIADMKNTGMGKGGAITAALFVRGPSSLT
jgi:hypothetical protein